MVKRWIFRLRFKEVSDSVSVQTVRGSSLHYLGVRDGGSVLTQGFLVGRVEVFCGLKDMWCREGFEEWEFTGGNAVIG